MVADDRVEGPTACQGRRKIPPTGGLGSSTSFARASVLAPHVVHPSSLSLSLRQGWPLAFKNRCLASRIFLVGRGFRSGSTAFRLETYGSHEPRNQPTTILQRCI